MKKSILFIAMLLFGQINTAKAQSKVYGDPIGDLTLVAATTAGGAILGLSTLSFVDEPSDNLKNILFGGAIGLIIGVALVAYSQAQGTQEAIEATQFYHLEELKTTSPTYVSQVTAAPYQLHWSFRF